jgi:uncharacterized protein YjbI with pentapeptide repeats
LWSANLKDAVFDGAQLDNADLDQANLDGVTVKGARIKKALFPFSKLTIDTIQEAVKSGARLRMEPLEIID